MLLEGIEDYMLPCFSKTYFNMNCLGCGAQRAAAFLFKGEFVAAFKMYPAIYTLLLFALFLIFNQFYKIKYSEQLKIVLVVSNILLIVINYLLKNFILT